MTWTFTERGSRAPPLSMKMRLMTILALLEPVARALVSTLDTMLVAPSSTGSLLLISRAWGQVGSTPHLIRYSVLVVVSWDEGMILWTFTPVSFHHISPRLIQHYRSRLRCYLRVRRRSHRIGTAVLCGRKMMPFHFVKARSPAIVSVPAVRAPAVQVPATK